MRTSGAILVVLLLASMLGTLVCAAVALTVGKPPDAVGLVCGGTMALSFGLLTLGEAVSRGGSPAKWRGTDVKVGRLATFAFGIGASAVGVVFLGYDLLPEHYLTWLGVAVVASFPLALLGQHLDGRAFDRAAARRRHAEPDAAADGGA